MGRRVIDNGDDELGYQMVEDGQTPRRFWDPVVDFMREQLRPTSSASVAECEAIVPDFDDIEDAARYAHSGYENAAQRCRQFAGYADV